MTIQEIDTLAKTYSDAIFTNELTKIELVMLLALIDARIKSAVFSAGTGESRKSVSKKVVKRIVPVVRKKKGIKYDPMFDPAPPFSPDPLPPPEAVEPERILVSKNTACICSVCNKVIYIVKQDVYNNCKIPAFIDSFSPTDGNKPIDRTAEIQNIDGQITTDCPSCGAFKTLYLTPKKR